MVSSNRRQKTAQKNGAGVGPWLHMALRLGRIGTLALAGKPITGATELT
jgi:hypothetical protein